MTAQSENHTAIENKVMPNPLTQEEALPAAQSASSLSTRRVMRRRALRIAAGSAAVALSLLLPIPELTKLCVGGAVVGWFLHLLDVQLTALDARCRVSFLDGWMLLVTGVCVAFLRLEPPPWAAVVFWGGLVYSLFASWRAVRLAAAPPLSHPVALPYGPEK